MTEDLAPRARVQRQVGCALIRHQKPLPAITVKPDSEPTATSGVLNAHLDPNGGGDIVSCKVEWGTSAEFTNLEYKNEAPCTPDPSGAHFSSPTDVQTTLSGLTSEATYHYRFVVGNANASRTSRSR